ncbi:TAXI family TRAP transporter solute-binding subunit [Methylocapsa acidiphila]|uniref:TAXI family TRAP transporter solute-binding subunit n=1 Tax=Methylocapsa acidiphila TaxID=133552 RepID=UPI000404A2C5|nr:TAXI family TRAP transporter solute-binding subunit [Methylocapsa acidiphila]
MLPRRRIAFSHMVYSSGFFFLTFAFALIAIGALTLRFAGGPLALKIAVGPANGDNAKLIAAIADRLEADDADMRLVVVPTGGPAQSAQALEQGRADLAVIRSDVAIPQNGATVVVLQNDVGLLLAPPGSALAKVAVLVKKRVGIFPARETNAALLDSILAEYQIAPESVQRVMLDRDELAPAVAQKRVDAVLAVGPLLGPAIQAAAAALSARNRAPTMIPIDAAEGMAAKSPAYQKVAVPAGFFRGSPPEPKEEATTVGVAVRLEANLKLPDEVVTDLTKRLFVMRRELAVKVPIAAAMQKPDTDKDSADAVHRGAADYYDNNEKSFMDRYGDWLYIGAMAFSGFGSAIAAMFGLSRAQARKAALALIDQLIEVKQVAHITMELPRLAVLDTEIENLSTKGLHFARNNNFDDAGLAALRLAIDEARRAVSDQRSELEARPPLLLDASLERPTTSTPENKA